jgi:hypothetical protein
MTDLHKHIQAQQGIAHNLCGLFEALAILDNEGCAPGAVTSLIGVGRNLAEALNDGLDSVNLPGAKE